ncbi:DNA mismatch repair protein MutS, partial [Polaribacter sp. MF5-112]
AQKNGIQFSLINQAKKRVETEKIRLDKTIYKLQKERNRLQKNSDNLEKQVYKVKENDNILQKKKKKIQNKIADFQYLYDINKKMLTIC